ncbi:MAG: tRNA preQ1(34) S-adenosylmethionine ribosyltransferase-isomerase QueA [Campylobacteraceae bacterium]|jgi:S-adenosylmethionine:tRNA ribosyltransferase-isomerase|nr:tRNA preQ1(34) S-adenosylmethionine ribosyltransferase-isomerase QueA [Campylobacteraceae bacterium]
MLKLDPSLSSSYDYHLPNSLIASHPIHPKENAALLVYERASNRITHAHFGEIFDFLPNDLSVLLNDTKVIQARIFGLKERGGGVELLFNSPLNQHRFKVHIKGRVKAGSRLVFERGLSAEVLELNSDGTRVVSFWQNGKMLETHELFAVLDTIGHVPLPPYIKRDDTQEDVVEYQTLFAKNEGAVAAPTASLHFSEQSFAKLQQKYETEFITLHVGAGTFKGVESLDIKNHTMHKEYFDIPEPAAQIIKSEKKILSVGTTVTRSIEYFVRTGRYSGECDLFLNPLNPPKRVDYLLTNFHLPRSTLIMLVAGFIGLEETLRAYREAVERKYRFFSYGDAMLIV